MLCRLGRADPARRHRRGEELGCFCVKPPEAGRLPEPEVLRNGQAYLKANPARLFLFLHTGHAAPSDQRFVTRGIFGAAEAGPARMVCLTAGQHGLLPGGCGRHGGAGHRRRQPGVSRRGVGHGLRPGTGAPDPHPVTDLGRTGEVPFAMVYDKAVFVAEAVGTVERPRFSYVFELPPSGNKPLRLTGGADDY